MQLQYVRNESETQNCIIIMTYVMLLESWI